MAVDISTNVVTWLQSISEVDTICDGNVHYNYVPDDVTTAYVWFRQSGEVNEACLTDAAGSNQDAITFDVEVCGTDLDDVAEVSMAIRNETPFRGSLGGLTVQGVFHESHDDDYISENSMSDIPRHVQSFVLRVFP